MGLIKYAIILIMTITFQKSEFINLEDLEFKGIRLFDKEEDVIKRIGKPLKVVTNSFQESVGSSDSPILKYYTNSYDGFEIVIFKKRVYEINIKKGSFGKIPIKIGDDIELFKSNYPLSYKKIRDELGFKAVNIPLRSKSVDLSTIFMVTFDKKTNRIIKISVLEEIGSD